MTIQATAEAPQVHEITQLIQRNFDAFRDDKPADADTFNHPQVTIWDVFTPELIRGDAARRAFQAKDHAQMRARGPLTLTVDSITVDSWADTALALYYVDFAYQPPSAAAGRLRVTDVFRKIDGRWQRIHHHEGLLPTGIPPLDAPLPGVDV